MFEYTELPSGAVLCSARYNDGAIMVVCDDLDIKPILRADRARQGVQDILDKLTADTLPQPPVLVEVHEAPCHRREPSD